MKYRVINEFVDQETGERHEVGSPFSTDDSDRATRLIGMELIAAPKGEKAAQEPAGDTNGDGHVVHKPDEHLSVNHAHDPRDGEAYAVNDSVAPDSGETSEVQEAPPAPTSKPTTKASKPKKSKSQKGRKAK